jgi:uncharacterized protein (DUF433 family)
MQVAEYIRQRDGNWYVGESRVSVYSVIAAWKRGQTPEQIHEDFPTLPLVSLYGTITSYLERQTELDAFFDVVKRAAAERKSEAEAANPAFYTTMRERFAEYAAAHPDLARRLAGEDQDESDQ